MRRNRGSHFGATESWGFACGLLGGLGGLERIRPWGFRERRTGVSRLGCDRGLELFGSQGRWGLELFGSEGRWGLELFGSEGRFGRGFVPGALAQISKCLGG